MKIILLLLLTFSLFTSIALCAGKIGQLGLFDSSYDRTVWQYVESSGGVDIFEHRFLKNCNLYSAVITETFEEEAKRTEALFEGKTYYVTKGLKDGKLISLYYCKKGSPFQCLRVYVANVSDINACTQASEKVIIDYERRNK